MKRLIIVIPPVILFAIFLFFYNTHVEQMRITEEQKKEVAKQEAAKEEARKKKLQEEAEREALRQKEERRLAIEKAKEEAQNKKEEEERKGLFRRLRRNLGQARHAVRDGLQPLRCRGETREERHAGQTFAVLERQLREGLASRPERFAVAYEPVWAIGTGRTATSEQAEETIAFIRGVVRALFGEKTADAIRIQYGGSMNPKNAAELMAMPDIDGGLIGGASLKAADFAQVVNYGAVRRGAEGTT